MRKVGVKALKNELSKHLRAVAAGETILVIDRSRIIAELRPPQLEDDGDEAARNWARMIREGIVTPAKRPLTEPMPPRLPPLTSFAAYDAPRSSLPVILRRPWTTRRTFAVSAALSNL